MRKMMMVLSAAMLLVGLIAGCSSAPAGSSNGSKESASSSAPDSTAATETQQPQSDYPKRPITVIVPWGTGGGSDQMTRALVKAAESVSNAKFVVQNMPGASGLTGLNYVMHQDADGYILYEVLTDQLVQMATGETKVTLDDIVPVVRTQAVLNLLYIKSSEKRFTNFDELAKYAKEHDGQVTVGTTGLNSFDSVMLSAIESKYGFKFKNVPFNKPAERYAALTGGFIDVLFEQIGDVKQFIDSGDYKPVIVYNSERMKEYPDVPTTVEKGIQETTPYSRGIWAKKGTPKEALDYWGNLFQKAMQTEEWKQFNKQQVALDNSYQDSEGFQKLLDDTYNKLKSSIK